MSWRLVNVLECDAFIQAYPRPLTVVPPLERKARFRTWSNPAHGVWPDSVVAKSHEHGTLFEIRTAAVR